jgi:predicted transcriptional regulator of viral defense system
MASPSQRERLMALAREVGVVTPRDARAVGVHHQVLTRLVREGILERIERGRYRLPDAEITEHHGLVAATAAVPRGVVCLLSALAFHGVGTQLPRRVWLAIERRSRKPKSAWPPLEVVRFSGAAFTEGIEVHELEGREVRIYNLPKTLADAFKYRNKIGLDVALEALHDAWRSQVVGIDEIERYARICRVARVMRPYLESLVA